MSNKNFESFNKLIEAIKKDLSYCGDLGYLDTIVLNAPEIILFYTKSKVDIPKFATYLENELNPNYQTEYVDNNERGRTIFAPSPRNNVGYILSEGTKEKLLDIIKHVCPSSDDASRHIGRLYFQPVMFDSKSVHGKEKYVMVTINAGFNNKLFFLNRDNIDTNVAKEYAGKYYINL